MKKKLFLMFVLLFTLLAAKATCSAAEILEQTDFGEGISYPWQVSENYDENSYSRVKDGAYMVHINSNQRSIQEWDIQICHKGISIEEGHTYTVSFRVRATKPCRIKVRVADADDKRNWKEYLQKEVKVTTSWNKLTYTFEADSSYSNVEFSMWLGGPNLLGNNDFDIYFDDMSLSDPELKTTPTPIQTPRSSIRVNQLGYYPNSSKKATMVSYATLPQNVQLKDQRGTVVWTGDSNVFGKDTASGETVHIIDFSDFKTVGKDYQLVSGSETSLPFDIGENIYSKMKYDALKYFYYSRSGINLEMPYCVESKWALPARDIVDMANLYAGKKYSDNGISTAYNNGPRVLDGTGGWYDGDNNKCVVYEGIPIWQLQNQYELASMHGLKDFEDTEMNIPESGNYCPDLLDEARWNIEHLLKVQIPAGYNKAGMVSFMFGYEEVLADPGPYEMRYYYPPTTRATLNFAACTAQSARLWKQYDAEFADRCLKAAENAWQAAVENPDVYLPGTLDEYNGNQEEIFYWAACELFITTGKAEYLNYLENSPFAFACPAGQDFGAGKFFSYSACGTIDLLLNRSICGEYGLYMKKLINAIYAIESAADKYLENQSKEGYGVPLNVRDYIAESDGLTMEIKNGYPMASNAIILNQSIIMAYAYEFSGRPKYLNGVTEAVDYLMGRNPILKCYVSGYGENPLTNPYHPDYCPQIEPSSPPIPPGFICSGPYSALIDSWGQVGDVRCAAQTCYQDNALVKYTNNVSVAYNAPLAWLTAFLDEKGKILPTPVPTPTPTAKPVKSIDLNGDGVINMMDIMLLAKYFGAIKTDEKFIDSYDLNSDGAINMMDIMLVAAKFNTFVN